MAWLRSLLLFALASTTLFVEGKGVHLRQRRTREDLNDKDKVSSVSLLPSLPVSSINSVNSTKQVASDKDKAPATVFSTLLKDATASVSDKDKDKDKDKASSTVMTPPAKDLTTSIPDKDKAATTTPMSASIKDTTTSLPEKDKGKTTSSTVSSQDKDKAPVTSSDKDKPVKTSEPSGTAPLVLPPPSNLTISSGSVPDNDKATVVSVMSSLKNKPSTKPVRFNVSKGEDIKPSNGPLVIVYSITLPLGGATPQASSKENVDFPGYSIVPAPNQSSRNDKEAKKTSPTIPVWTPELLGSAYGGGFVSSPTFYVTKLAYPSGPSHGIPPGYGGGSLTQGHSSLLLVSGKDKNETYTPIPPSSKDKASKDKPSKDDKASTAAVGKATSSGSNGTPATDKSRSLDVFVSTPPAMATSLLSSVGALSLIPFLNATSTKDKPEDVNSTPASVLSSGNEMPTTASALSTAGKLTVLLPPSGKPPKFETDKSSQSDKDVQSGPATITTSTAVMTPTRPLFGSLIVPRSESSEEATLGQSFTTQGSPTQSLLRDKTLTSAIITKSEGVVKSEASKDDKPSGPNPTVSPSTAAFPTDKTAVTLTRNVSDSVKTQASLTSSSSSTVSVLSGQVPRPAASTTVSQTQVSLSSASGSAPAFASTSAATSQSTATENSTFNGNTPSMDSLTPLSTLDISQYTPAVTGSVASLASAFTNDRSLTSLSPLSTLVVASGMSTNIVSATALSSTVSNDKSPQPLSSVTGTAATVGQVSPGARPASLTVLPASGTDTIVIQPSALTQDEASGSSLAASAGSQVQVNTPTTAIGASTSLAGTLLASQSGSISQAGAQTAQPIPAAASVSSMGVFTTQTSGSNVFVTSPALTGPLTSGQVSISSSTAAASTITASAGTSGATQSLPVAVSDSTIGPSTTQISGSNVVIVLSSSIEISTAVTASASSGGSAISELASKDSAPGSARTVSSASSTSASADVAASTVAIQGSPASGSQAPQSGSLTVQSGVSDSYSLLSGPSTVGNGAATPAQAQSSPVAAAPGPDVSAGTTALIASTSGSLTVNPTTVDAGAATPAQVQLSTAVVPNTDVSAGTTIPATSTNASPIVIAVFASASGTSTGGEISSPVTATEITSAAPSSSAASDNVLPAGADVAGLVPGVSSSGISSSTRSLIAGGSFSTAVPNPSGLSTVDTGFAGSVSILSPASGTAMVGGSTNAVAASTEDVSTASASSTLHGQLPNPDAAGGSPPGSTNPSANIPSNQTDSSTNSSTVPAGPISGDASGTNISISSGSSNDSVSVQLRPTAVSYFQGGAIRVSPALSIIILGMITFALF